MSFCGVLYIDVHSEAVAAAIRAGGMGDEPPLYALRVEPVTAFRHQLYLLPLHELGQADGALPRPRHIHPRRERLHWARAYRCSRRLAGVLGWVVGVLLVWRLTADVAADGAVEGERADEGAEEEDDGNHGIGL